jgi:regulatory protein YycI of two-component signal transduction system YycFG
MNRAHENTSTNNDDATDGFISVKSSLKGSDYKLWYTDKGDRKKIAVEI